MNPDEREPEIVRGGKGIEFSHGRGRAIRGGRPHYHPASLRTQSARTTLRGAEFFRASIRNPNIRRAYLGDVDGLYESPRGMPLAPMRSNASEI